MVIEPWLNLHILFCAAAPIHVFVDILNIDLRLCVPTPSTPTFRLRTPARHAQHIPPELRCPPAPFADGDEVILEPREGDRPAARPWPHMPIAEGSPEAECVGRRDR